MKKRLDILNIWVDPCDMKEAIDMVQTFLASGDRPHTIFAANPEKNFSVPQDPILFAAFKNADLLIPDGIGMVLAARILHGVRMTRVPGVDFMLAICKIAAQEGKKIFVFGAKEEVNKTAVGILKRRYPGLNIAGRSNGYVNSCQMPELIDQINDSDAEILFLALGSPKQEKWCAAHLHRLKKIRVCQGIGGSLDTIAGNVKRAPEIWQRWSAEWLFRLIMEPRRIRRQKVLPMFVVLLLIDKIWNQVNRKGIC